LRALSNLLSICPTSNKRRCGTRRVPQRRADLYLPVYRCWTTIIEAAVIEDVIVTVIVDVAALRIVMEGRIAYVIVVATANGEIVVAIVVKRFQRVSVVGFISDGQLITHFIHIEIINGHSDCPFADLGAQQHLVADCAIQPFIRFSDCACIPFGFFQGHSTRHILAGLQLLLLKYSCRSTTSSYSEWIAISGRTLCLLGNHCGCAELRFIHIYRERRRRGTCHAPQRRFRNQGLATNSAYTTLGPSLKQQSLKQQSSKTS
jgi:hypothetical protein